MRHIEEYTTVYSSVISQTWGVANKCRNFTRERVWFPPTRGGVRSVMRIVAPPTSDGSRDCPRLPLTCRVSSVWVLASSSPGPSTCTTQSRAVASVCIPGPSTRCGHPPPHRPDRHRVACVDHVGRAPVLGPNTVSQPPAAGVDRTWSWCRPKKEDWLKKKDRYQRRPGCGRKKTRHCWVSSSSGPQQCRSARVGELLLRAQPWHLVPTTLSPPPLYRHHSCWHCVHRTGVAE